VVTCEINTEIISKLLQNNFISHLTTVLGLVYGSASQSTFTKLLQSKSTHHVMYTA